MFRATFVNIGTCRLVVGGPLLEQQFYVGVGRCVLPLLEIQESILYLE